MGEEIGDKWTEESKSLVGKCHFCQLHFPGENAVFEVTQSQPIRDTAERFYRNSDLRTRKLYICGIGKQDCMTVVNYRTANHNHEHEHDLPIDLKRF